MWYVAWIYIEALKWYNEQNGFLYPITFIVKAKKTLHDYVLQVSTRREKLTFKLVLYGYANRSNYRHTKKRVISYVSLTTVKRQVEVLGNSKTFTYGLVQYKKDFN